MRHHPPGHTGCVLQPKARPRSSVGPRSPSPYAAHSSPSHGSPSRAAPSRAAPSRAAKPLTADTSAVHCTSSEVVNCDGPTTPTSIPTTAPAPAQPATPGLGPVQRATPPGTAAGGWRHGAAEEATVQDPKAALKQIRCQGKERQSNTSRRWHPAAPLPAAAAKHQCSAAQATMIMRVGGAR